MENGIILRDKSLTPEMLKCVLLGKGVAGTAFPAIVEDQEGNRRRTHLSVLKLKSDKIIDEIIEMGEPSGFFSFEGVTSIEIQ